MEKADTMLRKSLISLAILVGSLYLACEPEDWLGEVNCADCFSARPDSALLVVYVSISPTHPEVPLTFYRGDADGPVDWRDTARSQEFFLSAEVGRTYTVRAEYKSPEESIVAFDADRMELRDYGTECGSPCYILKGGIFDLQLVEE